MNNFNELRKIYKFKSGVLTLISVAERDGLKCDTCQNEDIHFELHPEHGMIMLKGKVRMTKDHDLLNSLEGSDGIDNQHLLCETCNLMRGNRFAEYKEFKDWYNSVLASGANPKTEIRKVQRNFSYTDFNKNGYKLEKLNTVGSINSIPQNVKDFLIQHFLKHQAFKPLSDMYEFRTLLSFSENAWNEMLNELMVKIVKQRTGKDIEVLNIKFNIFKSKKCKTQFDKFLYHLNDSIKIEYFKHKKCSFVVSPVIPVITNEVQQEVQEKIEVIEVKLSLFERLKNMFRPLITAVNA